MSTKTTTDDLAEELDKTLEATRQLDADRAAKALADYRAVVRGEKTTTPSDLLKLLDRCNLSPDDFKSDADAWREYQRKTDEVIPDESLKPIQDAAALSGDKLSEFDKFATHERFRLVDAMNAAASAMRTANATNSHARDAMGRLESAHLRIFS